MKYYFCNYKYNNVRIKSYILFNCLGTNPLISNQVIKYQGINSYTTTECTVRDKSVYV